MTFNLQKSCEIGMKIKKTNSVCRVPPASLSLDLTDTRACCCCCSNQLGIIIPWGLHEVLGGLRQHLLVVHTSFPLLRSASTTRHTVVDEIRLIHFWTFQIKMRLKKCAYLFGNPNHISQCKLWAEIEAHKWRFLALLVNHILRGVRPATKELSAVLSTELTSW